MFTNPPPTAPPMQGAAATHFPSPAVPAASGGELLFFNTGGSAHAQCAGGPSPFTGMTGYGGHQPSLNINYRYPAPKHQPQLVTCLTQPLTHPFQQQWSGPNPNLVNVPGLRGGQVTGYPAGNYMSGHHPSHLGYNSNPPGYSFAHQMSNGVPPYRHQVSIYQPAAAPHQTPQTTHYVVQGQDLGNVGFPPTLGGLEYNQPLVYNSLGGGGGGGGGGATPHSNTLPDVHPYESPHCQMPMQASGQGARLRSTSLGTLGNSSIGKLDNFNMAQFRPVNQDQRSAFQVHRAKDDHVTRVGQSLMGCKSHTKPTNLSYSSVCSMGGNSYTNKPRHNCAYSPESPADTCDADSSTEELDRIFNSSKFTGAYNSSSDRSSAPTREMSSSPDPSRLRSNDDVDYVPTRDVGMYNTKQCKRDMGYGPTTQGYCPPVTSNPRAMMRPPPPGLASDPINSLTAEQICRAEEALNRYESMARAKRINSNDRIASNVRTMRPGMAGKVTDGQIIRSIINGPSDLQTPWSTVDKPSDVHTSTTSEGQTIRSLIDRPVYTNCESRLHLGSGAVEATDRGPREVQEKATKGHTLPVCAPAVRRGLQPIRITSHFRLLFEPIPNMD